MRQFLFALFVLSFTSCKDGCRGATSEDPPVHPIRNMFTQDKGVPQRENRFFSDGRVMRTPVEGTVTVDSPEDETSPYLTGKTEFSSTGPVFIQNVPVAKTPSLLQRGQERYNIYCAPCHGVSGYGKGSVVLQAEKGGFKWAVPSYHQDRLQNREETPDGKIFDVITNGINTMPSYASQIPVLDRWAIVAYIRALQRSQHSKISDVPTSERSPLQ